VSNVAIICKIGGHGAASIEAALATPPKHVKLFSEKVPFKMATSFEQKVQFSCSEEFLLMPVTSLRLSSRAVRILRQLGLETISDVLDYGVGNFAGLKNIGELTSANIENAILDLACGESLNQQASFRRLLNSLLPAEPEKRAIIKARFGHDTGMIMSIPEVAQVQCTSEYRVGKMILREMPKMTLGQAGSALSLIRQRIEVALYANGYIAAFEDIVRHPLFRGCSRNHLLFTVNLLCALFPEAYRMIDGYYLTSLTPAEVAERTKRVISAYGRFLKTMSASKFRLRGELPPSSRYILHCLKMADNDKAPEIDKQVVAQNKRKRQSDETKPRGCATSSAKR
jgi:hypothetical protein